MKPSLISLLTESKQVCIMLPKNPYFDQVAAALGLYLSLKDKKPIIVCDSPMLVEFNRLIGVNKITQGAGNKNMVIKLINYPANQVERVTYDLDGNDLFLTVFPVSGVTPPTSENLSVNYSGVTADTVILIGGANETHFPLLAQKDFLEMKLIHIGINDITIAGREVSSLSRNGSTISEVVASLLEESQMPVDADTATNLFFGLTEGSKNFTGSNVSANSFQVASYLLNNGARREQMKTYEPKTPTPSVPKSWVEPKIYKGTSVN